MNLNRGDGGDLFHRYGRSAINPGSIPNTDSYQGGVDYPTGNELMNISEAGPTMTFTYLYRPVLNVDEYSVSFPDYGTWQNPFHTVTQANYAALNGYQLLIRAGYYSESPLPLIFNKQITLRSRDGAV